MSQVNRNYDYLMSVDGLTVWERLRVIRNFLTDRKQALRIAELHQRKWEATKDTLDPWEREEQEILNSNRDDLIQDCRDEIAFLEHFERRLAEEAEKERIPGKSDREMYEINFAKEAQERLIFKVKSEMFSIGQITPTTMISVMRDKEVVNRLVGEGILRQDIIPALYNNQPKMLSLTNDSGGSDGISV